MGPSLAITQHFCLGFEVPTHPLMIKNDYVR